MFSMPLEKRDAGFGGRTRGLSSLDELYCGMSRRRDQHYFLSIRPL
jgi:hypothetical protein